jgi:hypothetical protein
MPTVKVEIQRRATVESAVTMRLEIPEKVLEQDDPEAVLEWVEKNVSETLLDAQEQQLTRTVEITGADILTAAD